MDNLVLNYGISQELEARKALQTVDSHSIDITNLDIEIDVKDIDKVSNDEYIMLRRNGLGTSDSSIVLGVNPYKTVSELIKEKTSDIITAEERAVGELIAVRKGRDLEPLIIEKFEKHFKQETFKPTDMYRHKEYPYLKFNFDGVTGNPEQYIPAEIKVVTAAGEKHYNPGKAMFNEINGFLPLPEDVSTNNWSIQNKAIYYGIPPYYYTQLQQQILGLNAPYGYLSVLFERDWRMYTFFIWRDQAVINALITQGYKLWEKIEMLKGVQNEQRMDRI